MSIAFLIDFDGTITTHDTSEMVLRNFVQADWESFDQAMDRGEISLEECMRSQFALVHIHPSEIIKYLDGCVRARTGLPDLLNLLDVRGDHACIISAGMDFYIDHFMMRRFPDLDLARVSGRAEWKDGAIHFSFPPLKNKQAKDFKQDAVLEARKQYDRVVYVGDGSSDYNAARTADLIFAVRNSRLARLCQGESLSFMEFDDFYELADYIKIYL